MNSNTIYFQKQRNFGEIFNATFEFIRQEFKKFAKSLMFFSGPFILIGSIFIGYSQTSLFSMMDNSRSMNGFAGGYFIGMFFILLSLTIITNTVLAYVSLYLERGSDNFEVEDVWKRVKQNFWMILGTNFLITLIYIPIAIVSIILLEIPFIYVAVATQFIYAIRYFEKLSFGAAFSRCFKLIKDRWFFTFGLILVCSMVLNFLSSAASLPISIISGATAYALGFDESEKFMQIGMLVYYSLALISSYILMSVIYLMLTFNYFSLVEEKEHPHLFKRIEEINNPISI